jgi:dephospho-CoA kinase
MLIVGLTGGIASGKSTIARALQGEPGIAVVDADRLAWKTYRPGTKVYERLVGRFGPKITRPDGTIDRKALGELVFHDAEARAFVNGVVHPAVISQLIELACSYEAQGIKVLVIEAALLLESEVIERDFFDYYVIVTVEPEEQIQRLMARDGISREEALRKISAQTPQYEKAERADFILESRGSVEETIARARELFARLRSRAEGANT